MPIYYSIFSFFHIIVGCVGIFAFISILAVVLAFGNAKKYRQKGARVTAVISLIISIVVLAMRMAVNMGWPDLERPELDVAAAILITIPMIFLSCVLGILTVFNIIFIVKTRKK